METNKMTTAQVDYLTKVARLALINNNATPVRASERLTLDIQLATLQALISHNLFHDKKNTVSTTVPEKAPKKATNKVSKKAPKIHLKRKTQTKRFALWANGKKVERWYTAEAGWAPVIDLTGEDQGEVDTVDKKVRNWLEGVEKAH